MDKISEDIRRSHKRKVQRYAVRDNLKALKKLGWNSVGAIIILESIHKMSVPYYFNFLNYSPFLSLPSDYIRSA